MGAKIKVFNSKTCYVKFDMDRFSLSWHVVNKHDRYFLLVILPLIFESINEFDDENDLIKLIEEDVKQFWKCVKVC